jgi:response regulator RpfG family c-di-GMP phosphodiesterase
VSKGKILIIDDEEVIRNLFIDILSEDYDVVTVSNGEEGYQEAMTNDYDLMIVDIMLPGDDGLKIISHIKKNDADAVIIVISGSSTFENIQESLRLGVFDYVTKPFDIDQIVFAVRRAVASSNLIKANKRLMKELSIRNTVLEETIDERTERLALTYEHLQDVYMKIITTLVSVIEAKDPYTKYHSENVARYSVGLAKVMGLSLAQIELINKAAKLHDIGKITIHDSVLLKPERLTAEEYEEIKLHPLKAEEILKPLDFLNVAIELIKQHHEKYDGTGYPFGLKGEQIHLGARIMSVADAFDAMTSGRSYKDRSLSKEEAAEEIKNNAGTQFDPKVVDSFLQVIDTL